MYEAHVDFCSFHSKAVAVAEASDKSELINGGVFTETTANVYDRTGACAGIKTLSAHAKNKYINAWISCYKQGSEGAIGFMDGINGNDFQHNSIVYIATGKSQIPNPRGIWISQANIQAVCAYFAVRRCVEANWLNDRDNYLVPDGNWSIDAQFQSDCIVYTLFADANAIKSADGVNHWIPFTEEEVGAKDCFKSHFMSDFLRGRIASGPNPVNPVENLSAPLRLCVKENMSPAATSVLDAGRELWRYYHSQPDANPDASYYDIRMHFQGATVDAKGKSKMNSDSKDAKYTELIGNLRAAMKRLAKEIEPKVYEYGFLRK